MLSQSAPFPFAGSNGFLTPDGAPVRIIRTNLDGTAMVARLPQAGMQPGQARLLRTIASGNTTVPLHDLHPTAAEALGLPAPGDVVPAQPLHKRARRARRAAR